MIYNVYIHIMYTIYIIYLYILYIGSQFLVSHLVTTRDLTCSTWSWSPPRPPRNSTRTPRTRPPPTTSSPDSLARRAPLLPFPRQFLSRRSSHISGTFPHSPHFPVYQAWLPLRSGRQS